MGTLVWLKRSGLQWAGVILFVVGLILFVTARGEVTAFGWTAYTPLDQSAPGWPVAYLSARRVIGLGVGIAGLILVAGAIGFRLGVRRAAVGRPADSH